MMAGEITGYDRLASEFRQDWLQMQKGTGLTPLQISQGVKAASPAVGIGAGLLSGNVWVGLLSAVASFFASGPFAEGHKRIQLEKWRLKWLEVLSDMNESQLRSFAETLQTQHPMVFGAMAGLSSQPLLGDR